MVIEIVVCVYNNINYENESVLLDESDSVVILLVSFIGNVMEMIMEFGNIGIEIVGFRSIMDFRDIMDLRNIIDLGNMVGDNVV